MKNKKIILFAFFAALMCAACGEKKSAASGDSEDGNQWAENVERQRRDSTIYGVCSDGSTMHVMQLISDNGDTLHLNLMDAEENNKLFGGFTIGDRMAVLANDAKNRAEWLVNLNVLMGDWVMPNPLDGSSVMGFSIHDGGIVEGINQGSIIYKTWRLINGKFELTSVREGGGDFEESELYTLLFLSDDSLSYRNSEQVFEFNRPGKVPDFEELDDVDVKLDDDAEADMYF